MTEETKTTRKQPTKVQAVLTEPLRKQLTEFKTEKGYGNDGQALRAILSAFFNGETDISGYTTEHLENRINSLEDALYHDDKNIPKRAEEAFNEYKSLADAYEDLANSQREQSAKIRDLEKQIEEVKNSTQSGLQGRDISGDISLISEETKPVEAVGSATKDGGEETPTSEEKKDEGKERDPNSTDSTDNGITLDAMGKKFKGIISRNTIEKCLKGTASKESMKIFREKIAPFWEWDESKRRFFRKSN